MRRKPSKNNNSLVLAAIHRLEAKYDDQATLFKQEFQNVRSDIGELRQDVAGLKTDVAILKTDVAVLKKDVSDLKTDLADFKQETRRELKKTHKAIADIKVELVAQIRSQDVRITRLEEQSA